MATGQLDFLNLHPASALEQKGVNVGDAERSISTLLGAALVLDGVLKRSVGGLILAALGGVMIYRGKTGHCPMYSALEVSTAEDFQHNPDASIPYGSGVSIDKSITINRPVAEVHSFWRKLENLPDFMSHLESVEQTSDKRSHWVARLTGGRTVEWDAEINNEKENELIGWRSVEGSEIPNAGSVHFLPVADNRTEVQVVMRYDPPGGKIGHALAHIFGTDPGIAVEGDLHRLKKLLEGNRA